MIQPLSPMERINYTIDGPKLERLCSRHKDWFLGLGFRPLQDKEFYCSKICFELAHPKRVVFTPAEYVRRYQERRRTYYLAHRTSTKQYRPKLII